MTCRTKPLACLLVLLLLVTAAPAWAQLGTVVTLNDPGPPVNPAPGNVYLGDQDHLCLGFTLTAAANLNVVMIRVTNLGTATTEDWDDMTLRINGAEVAATAHVADDYTVRLQYTEPLQAHVPKTFQVKVSVSQTATVERTFQYQVSATVGAFDMVTLTHHNAPPVIGGVQTILDGSDRLEFLTQPGNGTGGMPLSPQPVLQLVDGSGEVITTDSETVVTASIVSGSSDPAGQVVSGASAQAQNGIVTFEGLAIDRAGIGYQLVFQAGALTSEPSDVFDVLPGPAHGLRVAVQPHGAVSGFAFVGQPRVELVDAGGNRFEADNTTQITAAIQEGSGAPGATLAGTRTAVANGGLAVWENLAIHSPGHGYVLTFQAEGLSGAVTDSFHVSSSLGGAGAGGAGGGCGLGSGPAIGWLALLLLLPWWRRAPLGGGAQDRLRKTLATRLSTQK